MDTNEIRESTWTMLKDLSCQYHASIHIVVKYAHNHNNHNHNVTTSWTTLLCASFYIETQDVLLRQQQEQAYQEQQEQLHQQIHYQPRRIPPQTLSSSEHRLRLLAEIRDIQRERIRQLFFSNHVVVVHDNEKEQAKEKENEDEDNEEYIDTTTTSNVIILVVDLDLWNVPKATQIINRAQTMQTFDVICGSGHWVDFTLESAQLELHKLQHQKRQKRQKQQEQQEQQQERNLQEWVIPKQPQDLQFFMTILPLLHGLIHLVFLFIND